MKTVSIVYALFLSFNLAAIEEVSSDEWLAYYREGVLVRIRGGRLDGRGGRIESVDEMTKEVRVKFSRLFRSPSYRTFPLRNVYIAGGCLRDNMLCVGENVVLISRSTRFRNFDKSIIGVNHYTNMVFIAHRYVPPGPDRDVISPDLLFSSRGCVPGGELCVGHTVYTREENEGGDSEYYSSLIVKAVSTSYILAQGVEDGHRKVYHLHELWESPEPVN